MSSLVTLQVPGTRHRCQADQIASRACHALGRMPRDAPFRFTWPGALAAPANLDFGMMQTGAHPICAIAARHAQHWQQHAVGYTQAQTAKSMASYYRGNRRDQLERVSSNPSLSSPQTQAAGRQGGHPGMPPCRTPPQPYQPPWEQNHDAWNTANEASSRRWLGHLLGVSFLPAPVVPAVQVLSASLARWMCRFERKLAALVTCALRLPAAKTK